MIASTLVTTSSTLRPRQNFCPDLERSWILNSWQLLFDNNYINCFLFFFFSDSVSFLLISVSSKNSFYADLQRIRHVCTRVGFMWFLEYSNLRFGLSKTIILYRRCYESFINRNNVKLGNNITLSKERAKSFTYCFMKTRNFAIKSSLSFFCFLSFTFSNMDKASVKK